MADHYIVHKDGSEKKVEVKPANNSTFFTLAELQGYVRGYVEFFQYGKHIVVVDEDGALAGKPYNESASMNVGRRIMGDVLVCSQEEAHILLHDDDEENNEKPYVLEECATDSWLWNSTQDNILEFATLGEAAQAAKHEALIRRKDIHVRNYGTDKIECVVYYAEAQQKFDNNCLLCNEQLDEAAVQGMRAHSGVCISCRDKLITAGYIKEEPDSDDAVWDQDRYPEHDLLGDRADDYFDPYDVDKPEY